MRNSLYSCCIGYLKHQICTYLGSLEDNALDDFYSGLCLHWYNCNNEAREQLEQAGVPSAPKRSKH